MPYDDRDAEVGVEIAKLHATAPAAKCPHCGSDKLIPNALVCEVQSVRVIVMSDPNAILFKGRESEEVTARVCGNCGFVQLFAKNPAVLYSVYQQSLKNAPLMKPES
jgi:predicted RNA-binding Zn-ribbon protein involved in translation (DUF1610 family)